MSKSKKLYFSVSDEVFDKAVSPDNLTLPLLKEFIEQVTAFLRGSSKPNLESVKTSIKHGSLAVEVEDEVGILKEAFEDYQRFKHSESIEKIDTVRAKVIEQWQSSAKEHPTRVYKVSQEQTEATKSNDEDEIIITDNTNFKLRQEVWLNIEKYVYGHIYDIGGKNVSNVHLELENGKSIKVGAEAAVLVGDDENRLYKNQLVRISAQQNSMTKELRNEKLISFENYKPIYDEDIFQKIATKARLAWKSVDSATSWVENVRGNSG